MSPIKILLAIIYNKIILGTAFAVLIAQFTKIFTNFFKTKTFDYTFTFSSSGMPSGHTSGVIALTTLIGIKAGFDSVLFALSFGIAVVIMYDAMGVRRQAGEHAKMLNYLLDKYTIYASENEDKKHYLKVRIGHTINEVLVGIVNGIFCALVFVYFFGL